MTTPDRYYQAELGLTKQRHNYYRSLGTTYNRAAPKILEPTDGHPMTPDQIDSLACFKGPISCQSLSGGITNKNYRVRQGDQSFMVRLCEDLDYLGIDRRNERVCQSAAACAGVSPAITYSEDGVLVSQFIEAATLTEADLQDAAVLVRVVAAIRRLHEARQELRGEMLYFCPFQTVRTYVATSKRIGARLPDDIDDLLQDANQLSRQISAFHPVLCHNDLLPANILVDSTAIWLVDWEYAGIGNPWFDLASLSSNCGLSAELESILLEAYCGSATAAVRRELLILKTASLLREALWAVIQTVKSTLTFDYHDYAEKNFQAYRRARVQLDL